MIIDDTIVQKYLSGESHESYGDCWIYTAFGRGNLFEPPNLANCPWVSRLCEKLKDQIHNFTPRNAQTLKRLFPDFDEAAANFSIMLVVGFPDPYDAMVMEHDGETYLVFDLIQFGADSLDENYSCHRVLTHELIHVCVHRKYPQPPDLSYIDSLNYTVFDEGFAHALSYPPDMASFEFDGFLQEKFETARAMLKLALAETNPEKQSEYSISADTGSYWDKFGSISGKLYLLKNIEFIDGIYQMGWYRFAEKIASST